MRAATRLQLLDLAIRSGSWRAIWRAILIALGLRRITPRPGELLPGPTTATIPDLGDTGGGGWYRPPWRKQDPAADPQEPGGGESSSRGNDHGWSNCTMAAGAMALAFHTLGKDDKWGGHLRHHQSDLEGGTDLYDLRDAWDAYGEDLSIRSGAGWEALKDDRAAGRALVVQGQGNVPGSESFDGGHACVISPETHSSGQWLFGDPLAGGWQWVEPSAIKSWMAAWSSGMSYARSAAHKPDDGGDGGGGGGEPPPPDTTPYDQADINAAQTKADAAGFRRGQSSGAVAATDAAVREWVDWLRAPAPRPVDVWGTGEWADLAAVVGHALEGDPCPDGPGTPALWGRGAVPPPVSDAYDVITTAPRWGDSTWAGTGWAT